MKLIELNGNILMVKLGLESGPAGIKSNQTKPNQTKPNQIVPCRVVSESSWGRDGLHTTSRREENGRQ